MHRALALVTFALLALAGCGGTSEFALTTTARAPGGDGTVQVEEIEGGNSLVTISLEHLPPPSSLGNGMTKYIVWFTGSNRTAQMASSLSYDEDNRTGSATATTPLRSFEIRITAERNENVGTPSDLTVVQRRVSQDD